MRRLNDEGGATIALFAVFMTTLFIVVAVVVDSGLVFTERQSLQNGGDAAALAIALDCAGRGGSATEPCPPAPRPCLLLAGREDLATAQTYANANAADGVTALDPLSSLPANPCVAPANRRGYGRVTVDLRSQEPGQLPAAGQLTLTLDDDAASPVAARTRTTATWFPIGRVDEALPLAISDCAFDRLTANGTLYGTLGNGPAATIFSDGVDCSGSTGPTAGAFGWMVGTDCAVDLVAGQSSGSESDQTVPNRCAERFDVSKQNPAVNPQTYVLNRPLMVPVIGHPNSGDPYRILGFATFVLTGWFLGPNESYAPSRDSAPCGVPPVGLELSEEELASFSAQRCIAGYFIRSAPRDGRRVDVAMDFGVRSARLVR